MAAAWLAEAVAALEAERGRILTTIETLRRYGGEIVGVSISAQAVDELAEAPARGRLRQAGERLRAARQLPGSPINRNEERAARIRALLSARGPMSTKAIADALGFEKSIIKQALQRLQKAGELERSGATAASRWHLPAAARKPARTLADVVQPAPAAVEDGSSAAALPPDVVERLDRSIIEVLEKLGSASFEHLLRRTPDEVRDLPVSDARKALARALARLEKMSKKIRYNGAGARWELVP